MNTVGERLTHLLKLKIERLGNGGSGSSQRHLDVDDIGKICQFALSRGIFITHEIRERALDAAIPVAQQIAEIQRR